MFDWLRYRWHDFILRQWRGYFTVGGHCGFCGKWISDAVVYKDWTWTLCEDAGDEGVCYLRGSEQIVRN